jgi:hypothetical protein
MRGSDVKIALPRGLRRVIPAIAATAAVTVLLFCNSGVAGADDPYDAARRDHADLFQAYYDEGLLEYCGLLTEESARGFMLRRKDLLAREPLDADQHRNVRIAASIAIDYQYGNHGLGGQKLWCQTAGRDAYNRFAARYYAEPSSKKVP